VGSFVVAAIVTPPDVLSQLLLAIPMCLLYEVGIIAARLFGRPGRRGDGGENVPEPGERGSG
jgi:sec-independent protein translocase protein TatC